MVADQLQLLTNESKSNLINFQKTLNSSVSVFISFACNRNEKYDDACTYFLKRQIFFHTSRTGRVFHRCVCYCALENSSCS